MRVRILRSSSASQINSAILQINSAILLVLMQKCERWKLNGSVSDPIVVGFMKLFQVQVDTRSINKSYCHCKLYVGLQCGF